MKTARIVRFGWSFPLSGGVHEFVGFLSAAEWRIVESNAAWLEEQAGGDWGVELPSVITLQPTEGYIIRDVANNMKDDIGAVLAEIATQSRYEEGAYVKRNLAFDAALGRIPGLAKGKVQP